MQTEIRSGAVSLQVVSHGNPLPLPVEPAPPAANPASGDYFESLEGIYIPMDQAHVVGPADVANDIWVVSVSLRSSLL